MSKFYIRLNRSRGQPGRGTSDHAWRVFENLSDSVHEYVVKHIRINVPVYDEQTGPDYNICCEGTLIIDKETSTAIIDK